MGQCCEASLDGSSLDLDPMSSLPFYFLFLDIFVKYNPTIFNNFLKFFRASANWVDDPETRIIKSNWFLSSTFCCFEGLTGAVRSGSVIGYQGNMKWNIITYKMLFSVW